METLKDSELVWRFQKFFGVEKVLIVIVLAILIIFIMIIILIMNIRWRK